MQSHRTAIRHVMHGIVHDQTFHFAAGTAFRATLGAFPLFLGAISVLAILNLGQRASDALGNAAESEAVPGATVKALQNHLESVGDPGVPHAITAILALSLAVWSGAAGFRTIMTALNKALDLDEDRSLVQRFFVSVGLAIASCVLAVAATVLVALGPAVGEVIRDAPGDAGTWYVVWRVLKWPLVAFIVFAWLATTYSLAPARRQRFRLVTPGIVIAFVAWLAFALVFSWYVDEVGNQGKLYGAFTGLIAFQLYVYWSAIIVLLGAQIDAVLREG